MSTITVSAEVVALLRGATAESELIGPDGRQVGVFIPHELPPDSLAPELYEDVTREELEAIEAAGGGIPHDEVVKRLGLA